MLTHRPRFAALAARLCIVFDDDPRSRSSIVTGRRLLSNSPDGNLDGIGRVPFAKGARGSIDSAALSRLPSGAVEVRMEQPECLAQSHGMVMVSIHEATLGAGECHRLWRASCRS
jgi:hypothetical protein